VSAFSTVIFHQIDLSCKNHYFEGDYSFGLAFGSAVVASGSIVIILGAAYLISIIPFNFGMKRHNRAVILICLIGDCIMLLTLLSIGTTLYVDSLPKFSTALRTDCSLTSPVSHTPSQCRDYYRADRTAAMRIAWSSYYLDRAGNHQVVVAMQLNQACCGFSAPFRCLNDTRTYPDIPFPNQVPPDIRRNRMLCGHHASNNPRHDYYSQRDTCLQYYDQTVSPPIIGGCKYDLGIGNCVNLDIQESSLGCASYFEDYINNKISTPAILLLASCSISFACILLSTVMFFKRKYEDVFPVYEQDVSKFNHVDFDKVQHQFTIQPKSNILVDKGFLSQEAMNKKLRPSSTAGSVPVGTTGDAL